MKMNIEGYWRMSQSEIKQLIYELQKLLEEKEHEMSNL